MAEVQEKATKKWQKLQAKRVSAQLATEELFVSPQKRSAKEEKEEVLSPGQQRVKLLRSIYEARQWETCSSFLLFWLIHRSKKCKTIQDVEVNADFKEMFAALNRAVKENVTFAEAKEWGIGQRVERVTKSKATPHLWQLPSS